MKSCILCVYRSHFNPSKPGKYGRLWESVNAGSNPYTFVFSPYCGKPNENGQYYIGGTYVLIQNLIDSVASHVDLKGRNLPFDMYFTSIPLAEWLLGLQKMMVKRNLSCIRCTILLRQGLTFLIRKWDFIWQKQSAEGEALLDFHVLGIARVNASTIFAMNNKKRSEHGKYFQISWDSCQTNGWVFYCQRNVNGLQCLICQKIQFFLKDKTVGIETQATPRNENGDRCNFVFQTLRVLDTKFLKSAECRVKKFCSLCNKAVCKKHTIHICSFCQNK